MNGPVREKKRESNFLLFVLPHPEINKDREVGDVGEQTGNWGRKELTTRSQRLFLLFFY